ncbi:MAG: ABC transporter substrate-binding protein [Acidobacteriota bacterium]
MNPARSLLACVALAALASCGGPGAPATPGGGGSSPAAPVAAKEKVLVFGRGGDSVSLDPGHEDDGESLTPCEMIYDTLVEFKRGSTDVEPALAESWDVTPDGLVYTFKLRSGVKFHDGTPFNADAVIFSLDRQRDPNHPLHGVGGAYKYWGNMGMSDIVGTIEKIDDLTVKFTLKRAEAPFLANLAMHFCEIVSPEAVTKWKEDYGRHPIGTGPFIFDEWVPKQKIVLKKNPDYWHGAPKIDRLIYRAIPEPNTRLLELRGGKIHGFDNPSSFLIETVKDDPSVQVLTLPGMNVGYLAMNTQKKPFDDKRVRQAISYAVNKQAIIDRLYKGAGVAAKNPLPPSVWGYDDSVADYPYDKEKAKALLAEAGYDKGFETTLWAMPNPRPYMPDPQKVAESLIADLAEVGIRARMVSYDWATYLAKTEAGEHDLALMGWSGDNGDPDNFLYILLSKDATKNPATNIAFWKNDAYSDLVAQAKVAVDHDKRAELYKKAQQIFHEEAPWVPLAHSMQVIFLKKGVEGFVLYPTQRKDFSYVDLTSS